VRERTAIAWTVIGAGKRLIEAKAHIRVKLGCRSPAFADALAMAVATDREPFLLRGRAAAAL